jgi:hypothetical protein
MFDQQFLVANLWDMEINTWESSFANFSNLQKFNFLIQLIVFTSS